MADIDSGTDYNLVEGIIDYEEGMLDGTGTLELFSNLISSGTIHSMQGHYGRQAIALVQDGWLALDGTILRYPEDDED